jgi:hypothetical protein
MRMTLAHVSLVIGPDFAVTIFAFDFSLSLYPIVLPVVVSEGEGRR